VSAEFGGRDMNDVVYIVREYNVYADDVANATSVWVGRGCARDYEYHGTKLVGPLAGEDAEEVIEKLAVFLRSLGPEVVAETGADD
jgi:hypothetical protein